MLGYGVSRQASRRPRENQVGSKGAAWTLPVLRIKVAARYLYLQLCVAAGLRLGYPAAGIVY